jgi:hypothetical protein
MSFRCLAIQKYIDLCDVVSIQQRSFDATRLLADMGCCQASCLQDIKMKMLAKCASGCPGINTLICNLSKTLLRYSDNHQLSLAVFVALKY